ncbi:MAG: sugar transferase EpsL [Phycisphaerales bacterium]|jgi:sugar transferase EpsL
MAFVQKLLAFLIFIALLPLLTLIGIAILITLGRPILFFQNRIGLDGKNFNIIKFRTMSLSNGDDAVRLTRFGSMLRRVSCDELPQILNILKGDMSFVGPRPLLPEYLPLYSKEQLRRHEVKPGISGWAQVNGRNAISWEEKFELDVWYVDNHTLFLDCKILVLTAGKVFLRSGINASGEATMPPFAGND